MKKRLRWIFVIVTASFPGLANAQEKVILDTDFNVLGDDGQVGLYGGPARR